MRVLMLGGIQKCQRFCGCQCGCACDVDAHVNTDVNAVNADVHMHVDADADMHVHVDVDADVDALTLQWCGARGVDTMLRCQRLRTARVHVVLIACG